MTTKPKSASPAADRMSSSTAAKTYAEENGSGIDPVAGYRKPLVEHWAEAFVDGPMKTIEQYDKAAKMLVTIVTPLQAALFTAYGQLAPKLPAAPPDWFTNLLLVLFVASVAGVFTAVVYVCNKRPRLIIERCDGSKHASRSGILSDLLASERHLSPAINDWEKHIEDVAACKHRWLTLGFACFLACSVAPVLVLIYLSFSPLVLAVFAASIPFAGAAIFFKPRWYPAKDTVQGARKFIRRLRGLEKRVPPDSTCATA
jgi:hypothetical protein